MQDAQVCYEEDTRKEKPRSAWKKNIEIEISKLILCKDLVEKTRKQSKLFTSETKSLQKIMRKLNLNVKSVTDLSEALVKKNESLDVYEKKITDHEMKIDISVGPEKIMNKKIDKEILPGDGLSPVLFVLCMDPLSRKLYEKYTRDTMHNDADSHTSKHLLFIDFIKLLATDNSILSTITDEAKEFIKVIGLEINKEKSAILDTCCDDTATLYEGEDVYKYLGLIGDSKSSLTRSSFDEVQSKLIARVERLCHT
ncbi:putative reverse transcriptase, partial [Hamiltosporidium tvaerminnensis]